jgi:hypothetical protein
VTVLLEKGYQKLAGQCKDLSEAGMGLLLSEEISMGEVLALAFSLPMSATPWLVRAVVRHRRGYHYGLEFLSLSREQGMVLTGFLDGLQRAD